jgi:hypothetical protein
LSTEISTRTSADSSLSIGLSTEISTRGSSDSSLSSAVSTEISTRGSSDSSLSSGLSTEISTRESADSSLSTSVSSIIYGRNFHYAQDLTTTTTTSVTPTYATKTGFTTSTLPIGTYKITYSCGLNKNVTNSDMLSRVTVDGTRLGSVQNHELSDGSTWLYVTRVMFITFASATTHTINLEFSQEAAGTQSIRDASLELIRVS